MEESFDRGIKKGGQRYVARAVFYYVDFFP